VKLEVFYKNLLGLMRFLRILASESSCL